MSTRLAQALLLPRPVSCASARTFATGPPPRRRENQRAKPTKEAVDPDAPSQFGFDHLEPERQARDDTTPGWLTPRPPGQGKRAMEKQKEASRSARPTEGSSSSASPFSGERGSAPPRGMGRSIVRPWTPRTSSPLHPTWKAGDPAASQEQEVPDHLKRHGFKPVPRNPKDFVGTERRIQEDLSIPPQIRHPNRNKEVPRRSGGFKLGERWEVDEVGKKVEHEEGVPKAVLTLHMNSLPVEATAQVIYPLLIQAGLHVSTCEAIVDGYRSTVIAELESDEGMNQALGRLLQSAPMLKNRIEITGSPETVSEYFTPSKERVAISNIPLHLQLPQIAKFLHISGVHSIYALQLVRLKNEIQHCGLAFLWTRESEVNKLVGRELDFEGTRMIVGVAREEPIPAQTNKSDFLSGPKVQVRPVHFEDKLEKSQAEYLATRR